MKEHKILIIICWIGNFPSYFQFFLHSCSFNSNIDFIIFTNNTKFLEDYSIPKNVKISYTTLTQLESDFSSKLNFEVEISFAYKLCDFKPAYGFLFDQHLNGYDFWGHCDLDIIFGNIRTFINEDLLCKFDVISSRHDYVTGSFALWRNTPTINKLFMKSKDYQMVFTSSKHFCFDECAFLFQELQNGASVFDFPEAIQSMTYVVMDEVRIGSIKAHFDFIIVEGTPGDIIWENGRIIYKNEFEAMYYHLIKFKESGIYPKHQPLNIHKMTFSENELIIT
jgi:hypothetical protein